MTVMELKALPIGFRFHPTDEELIRHYLKGKITGQIKSEVEVIPVIEVCKCEPWDLPGKSLIRSDDPEWFFFAPKEPKYPSGSSSNRATEAGYWKATGKNRVIKSKGEKQQQQHIIGKKKTLVFHCGRAPKGLRTRWFMHEYSTTEPEFFSGEQGGYVLYRLFKKQENNERTSPEEMDRSGHSPTPSRSIPDNMEAKEEANTPLIKESPVSALHASPVDLPGPIETQAAPITRWLADRTDNLVTNEANISLMPLHGHVDEGAKQVGPLVQYEQERDARIRENMERMQKLGILDLAHRFNQSATVGGGGGGSGRNGWRRKPETPGSAGASRTKPASPSPARRSLRLKSLDPVSYCETRTKKEKDLEGGRSDLIEEGSKEEIYTEEHEKLLGTCEVPWTLFVDGYDQDGKRIYDKVRGQTCHQCRHKTLGHHTNCCKCQIVQGQFCGDCLYMSYGENVLEAKKNPNWICPVCRGICNCSICRTKKGWFPTPPGCVYRKAVSLGYKSVAHYLIGTRRSSANSADSSSADSSNKLASTKSEASSISEHAPVAKQGLEDVEMSSQVNQNEGTDHQVKNPADGYKDDSRTESVVTSDSLDCQAKNQDIGCVTPSKPTPKKRKLIERSPDCVASRLRSQSNKS